MDVVNLSGYLGDRVSVNFLRGSLGRKKGRVR
jgi:hypothetical protein